MIRDERGVLPPVESRSISPGAARSKATEDFEDKKKPKLCLPCRKNILRIIVGYIALWGKAPLNTYGTIQYIIHILLNISRHI
jgi:hypothetical protein